MKVRSEVVEIILGQNMTATQIVYKILSYIITSTSDDDMWKLDL